METIMGHYNSETLNEVCPMEPEEPITMVRKAEYDHLNQINARQELLTSHGRCKQFMKHNKMRKMNKNSLKKVSVGSAVTIKIDKRDQHMNRRRGLFALVFGYNENTGSIKVVTAAGVVINGTGQKSLQLSKQ